MPKYTPEKQLQVFWSRINKDGSIPAHCPELGNCWEWTAGRMKQGYGSVWFNHKKTLSHIVAWELTNGSIPDGYNICHKCDNKICCNPEHLFCGTQKQNIQDAISKGRFIAGEIVGTSKFTWDIIRQVRALYTGKRGNQIALCRQFGISPAEMHNIVHKKHWIE